MAGRRGPRRRKLLLVAGMAGLVVAVVTLLLVWRATDLGTASDVGNLIAVALAVLAAAGSLASWAGSRRNVVASREKVESTADALAREVTRQCNLEARLRSLEDPVPMPVRWRLADSELADLEGQVAAAGWDEASDEIRRMAEAFRALGHGRLVILGGPGAGKTTLAVQLIRELIRLRSRTDPVPVLVLAAEWDTSRHPDVWEWLADQLTVTYPAIWGAAEDGSQVAVADLVSRHEKPLILPVIDGLDEVSPPDRAAVIHALNQSLGDGGVILTCRTEDYKDTVATTDTAITGSAVIQPAPLTPATAREYLARSLRRPTPSPAWQQVLDHLASQGDAPVSPLAEVCATPLGLWLVRAVYRPPNISSDTVPDPSLLLDPDVYPDAQSLRAHLFDALIPALLRDRRPSTDPTSLFHPRGHHQSDDVVRWLTWLAAHLARPRGDDGEPRTRDFAWWRLARHTLTLTRLRTLTALTTGLPAGLAVGLIAGPAHGLRAGLGGVVGGALITLVVVPYVSPSWLDQDPGYANLTLRRRTSELVKRLAHGLGIGLLLALALGLPAGLSTGLTAGIAAGLGVFVVTGFATGLPMALVKWAETPAFADRLSTPAASLQGDRVLTIFRMLVMGLVIGPIFGLMVSLQAGLVGFALGLVFGLVTGLRVGDHHAWWCYLLATIRLRLSGQAPLRLMDFLDDAHRLGLLRAVGPVYQFRHAEFQDHLAARQLEEHR